jgi:hypothetical protein
VAHTAGMKETYHCTSHTMNAIKCKQLHGDFKVNMVLLGLQGVFKSTGVFSAFSKRTNTSVLRGTGQ